MIIRPYKDKWVYQKLRNVCSKTYYKPSNLCDCHTWGLQRRVCVEFIHTALKADVYLTNPFTNCFLRCDTRPCSALSADQASMQECDRWLSVLMIKTAHEKEKVMELFPSSMARTQARNSTNEKMHWYRKFVHRVLTDSEMFNGLRYHPPYRVTIILPCD